MDQFIPQLVSAAVIGAVSPIATMATIVVLSSKRALTSWVLGVVLIVSAILKLA